MPFLLKKQRKMKLKILLYALFFAAATVPAYPQAEIMTKKKDIGDVSSMITKVVISGGDAFVNMVLEDEIERNWTVSPYEFCDMEEFERLKCDTNYFFLIRTKGQYGKESGPSVEFLSLLRGGPKAEKGIDGMPEVISLPFRTAEDDDGRCMAYIPAFINIIQEHVPRVTKSDISAYTAMKSYSRLMPGCFWDEIVFAEEDMSPETAAYMDGNYAGKGMRTATDEEINEILEEMRPGTIVSYTIIPEGGKFYFKMLVSAEDYSLFYYKKQRIPKKQAAGFSKSEIRKIAATKKDGR